jgi:hypothetical protein
MSRDLLDKSYSPEEVEKRWYAYWEQEKLFAADENTTKKPYSIVIPPPNVTGVLHMGHALNNTMQDIMCRYRRLKGDSVLWMPGRTMPASPPRTWWRRNWPPKAPTATSWAGINSSRRSGAGARSTAVPSSTSSNAWGPPATGTGNASPWTRGSPGR